MLNPVSTMLLVRTIVSITVTLFFATCLDAQANSGNDPGRVVQRVAELVEQKYFDKNMAQRVATKLKSTASKLKYSKVSDPSQLAKLLTEELQAITDDLHLAVGEVRADNETGKAGTPRLSRDERGRRCNYGFQKVEILPGNVGYLNVTSFYRPNEATETMVAVMKTLQHVDALIVDMRENQGGRTETVAMLASYFFSQSQLLFEVFDRQGEKQKHVADFAPAKMRKEKLPMYVLTSARTFSGGEGFAFLLQDLGRAQVVGEVTKGAANPGRRYTVNSQFEVNIPNAKLVCPSGRNWEGVGVRPDILVADGSQLECAYEVAIKALTSTCRKGREESTKVDLR